MRVVLYKRPLREGDAPGRCQDDCMTRHVSGFALGQFTAKDAIGCEDRDDAVRFQRFYQRTDDIRFRQIPGPTLQEPRRSAGTIARRLEFQDKRKHPRGCAGERLQKGENAWFGSKRANQWRCHVL